MEINQEFKDIEKKINFFKKLAWSIIIIGLIVFIGCISILWFRNNNLFNITLQKYSNLGDLLSGTVVAFWSLGGVLFIYIAFLGQKQDLILQREELVLTRNELKLQREQFEIQNKTLEIQKFENTFFNMINLHHNIIQSIGYKDFDGRRYFQKAKLDLINNSLNGIKSVKNQNYSDSFDSLYSTFVKLHFGYVGHYFRNLYTIYKFIDASNIEDKKFYTDIIKSQLSSAELYLIFFNGISKYSEKNFKPLIEKYNIIEQLEDKDEFVTKFIGLYKIVNGIG